MSRQKRAVVAIPIITVLWLAKFLAAASTVKVATAAAVSGAAAGVGGTILVKELTEKDPNENTGKNIFKK